MAFGGGVGVEVMTGGVRVRSLGAGDAGGFEVISIKNLSSGLLMIIAALFLAGLAKAGDAGAAFVVVYDYGRQESLKVSCGCPMLEAGRCSDICEEFRDMG